MFRGQAEICGIRHTALGLSAWPGGWEHLLATAGYHWGRMGWLA